MEGFEAKRRGIAGTVWESTFCTGQGRQLGQTDLSAELKIVFLSPAAQMGGAETVLLELLRALREARPHWLLHVIAGETGPLLEKVRDLDVGCEVLPFPVSVRALGENRHRAPGVGTAPHWPAKAIRLGAWVEAAIGAFVHVWRLRRLLFQLHPNILHSNGMKMHLLGALAKPGDTTLVWHFHDYLRARPVMLPLLRTLTSRCRMIIANSESVAADIRLALRAGPPVHTVFNAVDPEIFTPDGPATDLDRAAGLPVAAPGTVRVGLVATFALWKGHRVFLQAAALLANQAAFPAPLRFYVIGGPVYATVGSQWTLEALRELARREGHGDRVGFTGFLADAPGAMRALDIVIHASTEPEPFGLVIVQAMACARAVVASAAGGARELVEAGTDALVHAPGDADGLAQAIAQLAADAGLRGRLGQAARAKVRRIFTRARMVEAVAPLYEDLHAARRP